MRMRTIVLATFGSFGDIHPYMAIGLELKARGHKPIIATCAIYRDKIESAGLIFEPMRPDLPTGSKSKALIRCAMDAKSGTETVIRTLVLGGLEDSYADLRRIAERHRPDLFIAHALAYAVPIICEQLSVPWVFTALQPIIMFSAADPSVPPDIPWAIHMRLFGQAFYRKLMEKGTSRMIVWAQPIYALREKLGLSTNIQNPLIGGHFSPYQNLAMFSRHFAPPAADWPKHTIQTGFAFYDAVDATQALPAPELLAFLDAGDSPIVFTLGTAAVRDARDFYAVSLAAARALGKRSVLLTGIDSGNTDALALGPDTLALDYAPYASIFPSACAIVHQGGIGTTSQALRAGKPMLVMPYGHDQPDNARRCVRLGVARTIGRGNYSVSSVANAINHLLLSPGVAARAEQIAEQIRSEHGSCAAADEITALID